MQINEQDLGIFNAEAELSKKKVSQAQTEVMADSGAMPVAGRDDSSDSSINSVKNKCESEKIDSARQNQFKMKWQRV